MSNWIKIPGNPLKLHAVQIQWQQVFMHLNLLPQLNSARSSRHNIFVGRNEQNKVGVRDGGGAK